MKEDFLRRRNTTRPASERYKTGYIHGKGFGCHWTKVPNGNESIVHISSAVCWARNVFMRCKSSFLTASGTKARPFGVISATRSSTVTCSRPFCLTISAKKREIALFLFRQGNDPRNGEAPRMCKYLAS